MVLANVLCNGRCHESFGSVLVAAPRGIGMQAITQLLAILSIHYRLLQYYDLTSVSLRAATWHLMAAGIDGFKVSWWDPVWVARFSMLCSKSRVVHAAASSNSPYGGNADELVQLKAVCCRQTR